MVEALSSIQQVPSSGFLGSNALGNLVEFPVCHYRIPEWIGNSLGDRGSASTCDNTVQFCLQNL